MPSSSLGGGVSSSEALASTPSQGSIEKEVWKMNPLTKQQRTRNKKVKESKQLLQEVQAEIENKKLQILFDLQDEKARHSFCNKVMSQ